MIEIAALLVGINKYPVFPLNFCVNDLKRVRGYFESGSYAPDDEHLRELTDEAATREAILDGLKWLCEQDAKTALFYYSGHGTTLPDYDGDEGSGNPDTAVVPVDWANGLLVDDEIKSALEHVNSDKLIAIFDCCHSGRMDRAFDFLRLKLSSAIQYRRRRAIDSRLIPHARLVQAYDRARALAYKIQNPKLVSIAACKPDEVAEETVFDNGEGNGVLTNFMFNSVNAYSTASYESVITATRKRVKAGNFAQHIQLRAGNPGLLRNRFLR